MTYFLLNIMNEHACACAWVQPSILFQESLSYPFSNYQEMKRNHFWLALQIMLGTGRSVFTLITATRTALWPALGPKARLPGFVPMLYHLHDLHAGGYKVSYLTSLVPLFLICKLGKTILPPGGIIRIK